ncbi:hypothetical protein LZ32DRAFT_58748 [Colletotrichum eremochloae]|nr:hypothetical protein LZ32DRAFT_58748 [Colletotrichum eremochloae]
MIGSEEGTGCHSPGKLENSATQGGGSRPSRRLCRLSATLHGSSASRCPHGDAGRLSGVSELVCERGSARVVPVCKTYKAYASCPFRTMEPTINEKKTFSASSCEELLWRRKKIISTCSASTSSVLCYKSSPPPAFAVCWDCAVVSLETWQPRFPPQISLDGPSRETLFERLN